jgi:hypothetical protein
MILIYNSKSLFLANAGGKQPIQRQLLVVQYKQQAKPLLWAHNYTPLVISMNDKNKRLTIIKGIDQWEKRWVECSSIRWVSLQATGKNYSLQIIETGFAEQFYASHRMGPAPICLKISVRIALWDPYRMIALTTRLFSDWSIPLSQRKLAITVINTLFTI